MTFRFWMSRGHFAMLLTLLTGCGAAAPYCLADSATHPAAKLNSDIGASCTPIVTGLDYSRSGYEPGAPMNITIKWATEGKYCQPDMAYRVYYGDSLGSLNRWQDITYGRNVILSGFPGNATLYYRLARMTKRGEAESSGIQDAYIFRSKKKGVGVSKYYDENLAKQQVDALKVYWYYNWSLYPSEGVGNAQFVPTFSGKRFDADISFLRGERKNKRYPMLITFIEPESKMNGNTPAERAVSIWPELSNYADRIGSPSAKTAYEFSGQGDREWYGTFYRAASDQHLRIDFQVVHYLGRPDSARFLKRLDLIHQKYGKPILINALAVKEGKSGFSADDAKRFMLDVMPEFEKRDYIIGYAWYGAGDVEKLGPTEPSALFDDAGNLTELGRVYRDY